MNWYIVGMGIALNILGMVFLVFGFTVETVICFCGSYILFALNEIYELLERKKEK